MKAKTIRRATIVLACLGFVIFSLGIYGLAANEKLGFIILSAFNLLIGFGLMLWNVNLYLQARELS